MTRAFTLIELLVVVTIIVVLLALLAPAMDKAVGQAQMAVCASRLGSIALAANGYAGENRSRYPYRRVTDATLNPPAYFGYIMCVVDTTTTLAGGVRVPVNPGTVPGSGQPGLYDDRPTLYPHFGGGLKMMHDPLTGGNVDFAVNTTNSSVFVDYMLYFGVRYTYPGGGKGMLKIGDRLEWTESGYTPVGGVAGRRNAVSLLASDQDVLVNETDPYQKIWSSHPDAEDKMTFYQGTSSATLHYAKWLRPPDRERGEIDTQYAYGDGSVERFTRVTYDESERSGGRMGVLPAPSAGSDTYTAQRVPLGR